MAICQGWRLLFLQDASHLGSAAQRSGHQPLSAGRSGRSRLISPVRWGMVARPEEYRRSSATLFESCLQREADGVNGPSRERFEAGV